MMGHHPPGQDTLFYTNIILEERVRKNHPLRKINELIDFEFTYKEVKDKYGSKGNVSVPPSFSNRGNQFIFKKERLRW